MTKVVAKFVCVGCEPSEDGRPNPIERVRLSAVYGDGKANKAWSEATPYGVLDMVISNRSAFGSFVPGEEYFVTFDQVKSPVSAAAALQDLVSSKKAA